MKKLMFSFLAVLYFGIGKSQSLPFSQIDKVASALSPSLCGKNMKQNVNFMHYRQGISISKPVYKNYFLTYDGGISINDFSHLGWGLDLFSGVAGESKFGDKGLGININYSRVIFDSESYKHSLSFGSGFKVVKRDISLDDLRWPSQIDTNGFNPNIQGEDITQIVYPDLSCGLSYIFEAGENKIIVGTTLDHTNTPNISITSSGKVDLTVRKSFFVLGNLNVTDHLAIKPQFFHLTENKFNWFIAGASLRISSQEKKHSYELGSGLRDKSLYFNAGFSIKNMYNLNISYCNGNQNKIDRSLDLNLGVSI